MRDNIPNTIIHIIRVIKPTNDSLCYNYGNYFLVFLLRICNFDFQFLYKGFVHMKNCQIQLCLLTLCFIQILIMKTLNLFTCLRVLQFRRIICNQFWKKFYP